MADVEPGNGQVVRDGGAVTSRRKFLRDCGRFAAVTTPTVTLLLSTSGTTPAMAGSHGATTQSCDLPLCLEAIFD